MSYSDWAQAALFSSSEVLELNVKLGVIPSTDHAQAWVELKDPLTGVQLAMWSTPHERWSTWPHMLDTALAKAHEQLGRALEPF